MAIVSLPYRIELGQGLLPLCDVHVIGPAIRVRVKSLIDTGASSCIFPTRVAEDAEIDLSKARPQLVQYGGGPTPGRRARVYVEVGGLQCDIDAIFVDKLELPYALLGRRGVFARFKEVTFLEQSAPPRVELRSQTSDDDRDEAEVLGVRRHRAGASL